MSEKHTNRVTLEDLAQMVERDIAHKEDIECLEGHILDTRNLVLDLPARLLEKLAEHHGILGRPERPERHLNLQP